MAKKFYYGGQAVIEGVMMRGKRNSVTAVRRPGGEVVTDVHPLHSLYTGKWRQRPLVRGIIVLIESMVLGIQSLMYSANVALEEEEEEISGGYVWLLIGVSLLLGVGLFFLAPLFITRFLNSYLESPLLFNLVEGLVRVAIFVIYLRAVTLMPDIKRVFAYHGAEHKTVHAQEAGVPLEVSQVQHYTTAHSRCGTSFLFAVLIIAILIFALVGKPALWLMILSRVVLVPVIAALGYEFIQFSANHTNNFFMKALMSPGLWLQSLTTREPDDSQVEVAITALKEAMALDAAGETAAEAGA